MSELGSGSGSSYPSALDTNTTLEVNSPSGSKTKARAEVPNDSMAAIVAMQTELGTDPAGTKTDVKTYLQTEHNADGSHSTDITSVRDTSRGLTVIANVTNPTYEIDIDADEIMMHDGSANPFRNIVINVTTNITASGANGLDAGSEATSTLYYAWVIYNQTTTTTAGLLSLSKTAPTMPSGYTYKSLVGEIYNDSSSDIEYVDSYANMANTVKNQGGGVDLKVTVVDIGDWDMVASPSVNVAHGITLASIRSVSCLIRNDVDDEYDILTNGAPDNTVTEPAIQVWLSTIDATNVVLARLTGGGFDSIGWDSTSYNRGWVTIWHV